LGPSLKGINETIKVHVCVSPRNLCIYEDQLRDETLNFLHECDKQIFFNDNAICVDLRKLEYITAAASVLLFSTISRAKFCGPYQFASTNVTVLFPIDKKIKRNFRQWGFNRALRCKSIPELDSLFNENGFYITGSDPKLDGKKISDFICTKYEITKLPNRLSSAIQEGLLNILHHAYDEPVHNFMRNRWWCVFAVVENNSKRYLQCIILDRGKGIKKNILGAFPLIQTQAGSEGFYIGYAMNKDISSTHSVGRGQGSEDLKHPVMLRDNDDYLSVLSHRGGFTQDSNSKDEMEYSKSVGGTIIEWRLAFDE